MQLTLDMQGFRVKIIGYVDDHQPGWVKCVFKDAHGKNWSIIEKVPVITQSELDLNSQYPQDGFVACEILTRLQSGNIVKVDTSNPWGISAEGGGTIFDMHSSQIVDSN
jgi:hypothetical protein